MTKLLDRALMWLHEQNVVTLDRADGQPDEGRPRHYLNHTRRRALEGGMLARLDPVAQGRVQFLRTAPTNEAQASAAVDELIRLSRLVPDWSWSGAAIIAWEWRFLEPVRSYC